MMSSPSLRRPFLQPATFFLILGLLSGIAYCIFIPYGAGFDEEQHVARILELARYRWLPNSGPSDSAEIFPEVLSLSYQRRYFLEPAGNLLGEEFSTHNERGNDLPFTTRSIYNPLIFLPQGMIARWFWLKYDYPFIPILILCRLASFVFYLAGSYLAIRVIPIGKWIMVALALSPMAMFQAATLNTDGFTNAACFLFIAFALEFMLNRDLPANTWKILGLATTILLLGISKSGDMLLLPLLFLLPYRQFPNRKWGWIILTAVLLAFGLSVGWSVLSIPASHYGQSEGGTSFGTQWGMIQSHALEYLGALGIEIFGNLGLYYRNWLASYGHWVGIVPEAVYWLYPFALLAALFLEPLHPQFSLQRRFSMAVLSVIATLLTEMFFFGLFYAPDMTGGFGRQGRYFISTLPLFFLAFSAQGLPGRIPEKWLRRVTVTLLAFVVALYSFGLYATYYTHCASTYYTFQSCQQPIYKQIDLDTAPIAQVHADSVLTQTFTSLCGPVNAVRVRVLDLPEGVRGTLMFSLFSQDDRLLASQEIPLADLISRQYIELPVATTLYPEEPLYRIQLEGQDIPLSQPLPLVASTGDQYRDGKLSVNQVEQPNDLIFKYLCPGYWQQILSFQTYNKK
jgi:uncharacterized membrane protein